MKNKTRLLLRDAFRQKNLFGAMIDYQDLYLKDSTYDAFENGAVLAEGLRRRGITLMHFMATKKRIYRTFRYRTGMPVQGWTDFCIVRPRAGEMVFARQSSDGLTNRKAAQTLRNDFDQSVLIMGGVYSFACFKGTIEGTLERTNVRVIAATDATDDRYPDIMEKFYARMDRTYSDRLLRATTAEILATLERA